MVERVHLGDDGLGIEAQARRARYQAFAQTLLPGEVLMTAQHLDDQCETFLLALKRGEWSCRAFRHGRKLTICRNPTDSTAAGANARGA